MELWFLDGRFSTTPRNHNGFKIQKTRAKTKTVKSTGLLRKTETRKANVRLGRTE